MSKEQLVEVLRRYTKRKGNEFQFEGTNEWVTFTVNKDSLDVESNVSSKIEANLRDVQFEEEGGYAFIEVTLPNKDTYTFVLGGKK